MKNPEDRLTKGVGTLLNEAEYQALKVATDKQAVNLSKLIRVLLQEWLEHQKAKDNTRAALQYVADMYAPQQGESQ